MTDRTFAQDEIDEDMLDDLDDEDAGVECGRWRNGLLSRYCLKAGSEECDFVCPYRDDPADKGAPP